MKILKYPHPALRAKARPVERIDNDLVAAANDMLGLMYRHEGLGLAAPQVGLDLQMLVINFVGDSDRADQQVVAINPTILEQKGAVKDREGCLSFPGLYQDVRRAKAVRVRAYGLDGQPFEMECADLAARVWLHEVDHLNGTLFIDKMGPLARLGSKRAVEEFIAEFEEARAKGAIPPETVPKL